MVLLVGAALILAAVAAAPNSGDAPQALHNEAAVDGTLAGNSAGAFDYYSVQYAGDESVVTIEVRYRPADPVTKMGFGLNVYGPNGYFIGQGRGVMDTGGDGLLRLQYSDSNPATWLVQVYNYIPDHAVSYSIVVDGLTEAQQPAATAATLEAVAQPEVEPAAEAAVSGHLVGSDAGAFAFYSVQYPGEGSVASVEMRYVPGDPITTAGVGLNVYGPAGQLVGRGHQVSNTGGDGLLQWDYRSDEACTLVVQVYNYLDGGAIHYSITGVELAD